jgi:hypothetical protein
LSRNLSNTLRKWTTPRLFALIGLALLLCICEVKILSAIIRLA